VFLSNIMAAEPVMSCPAELRLDASSSFNGFQKLCTQMRKLEISCQARMI
jgi:hypothetical protein